MVRLIGKAMVASLERKVLFVEAFALAGVGRLADRRIVR